MKLASVAFTVMTATMILMTPVASHAIEGTRGGGDVCEDRIKIIRDDIKQWIHDGGPEHLPLPSGISVGQYSKSMLAAISSAKIKCVGKGDPGYPVEINNTPKACRFDKTKQVNWITCDFIKFNATNHSAQYVQIHHEYAGLASIELPNGDDSHYTTSNHITDYLVDELIPKLAVKPLGPSGYINYTDEDFGVLYFFSNFLTYDINACLKYYERYQFGMGCHFTQPYNLGFTFTEDINQNNTIRFREPDIERDITINGKTCTLSAMNSFDEDNDFRPRVYLGIDHCDGFSPNDFTDSAAQAYIKTFINQVKGAQYFKLSSLNNDQKGGEQVIVAHLKPALDVTSCMTSLQGWSTGSGMNTYTCYVSPGKNFWPRLKQLRFDDRVVTNDIVDFKTREGRMVLIFSPEVDDSLPELQYDVATKIFPPRGAESVPAAIRQLFVKALQSHPTLDVRALTVRSRLGTSEPAGEARLVERTFYNDTRACKLFNEQWASPKSCSLTAQITEPKKDIDKFWEEPSNGFIRTKYGVVSYSFNTDWYQSWGNFSQSIVYLDFSLGLLQKINPWITNDEFTGLVGDVFDQVRESKAYIIREK